MLARVSLAPEQPAPEFQPARVQIVASHPEPESALTGREPEMVLEGATAGPAPIAAGPAPIPMTVQTLRSSAVDPNDPSTWRNAGRNALCPCGSGRKYKYCHGRLGS
jgi:preprotein translocase subunit SecA